ncbi:MAG: YqgE/AlgH family protein [Rhodobiaceae bacterium]|nr:YqgE/AlgH family protein [Rhodobiaceae bacterium]MCC0014499.1 YqgE/AlgH family protein [Rhodobiaceae bacterium]MCC0050643.1 YqgE/AlgH family protein [Rhodobiaceae bacterium]MCC0059846.1 YqgE/AlgH family protein [Rhodobiaceae bacterium]
MESETPTARERGPLHGRMLVAMPGMPDPRFARSVILICAHSPDGAMGLRVDKLADDISFPDLLQQLEVLPAGHERLTDPSVRGIKVHSGGPVETGRGFVLHSPDYHNNSSTLKIDTGVSLTATLDVLKAIAMGTGPGATFMALGYAGWGAGQLESEIQANGWLHCDADRELIFGNDLDDKYDMALAKIGIDPGFLSGDAGHA